MDARVYFDKATKESKPQIKSDMAMTNRHEWIATYAYFLSEARGFRPGLELEDWLEAECAYEEQVGMYISFSL